MSLIPILNSLQFTDYESPDLPLPVSGAHETKGSAVVVRSDVAKEPIQHVTDLNCVPSTKGEGV